MNEILGASHNRRKISFFGMLKDVFGLAVLRLKGGCGVTGFACSIPVSGRHIFEPSVQMHNRGNGKGGGLAAIGLAPDKLGVDQHILDEDFLLQIALLDKSALKEVEERFVKPCFRIDHEAFVDTVDDYRDISGLEVKPPEVKRYFVRVKPKALAHFQKERGLKKCLPLRRLKRSLSIRIPISLILLCTALLERKGLCALSWAEYDDPPKIVGYAEQVAQYYKLRELQRPYLDCPSALPYQGTCMASGRSHPFIGLDEALVHNGDFANYYSVSEYLKQRNVYPLFLTDTEVSVQVFDLLNRV